MRTRINPAIFPTLALVGLAAAGGCSSGTGDPKNLTPRESLGVQSSALVAMTDVAANYSDANGWAHDQYGGTIRFADLDGDGKADVCGRGVAGILCQLSTGTGWGKQISWGGFSDAGGWNAGPYFYSTIRFPDLNGDGKADICGRGYGGIVCYLGTGSGFTNGTNGPALANGSGVDGADWSNAMYYSTIQYPDINGDGKADIAVRGSAGIHLFLDDGNGNFSPPSSIGPGWSDDPASGWNYPQYYSTIQYPDINGDGKADICARSASSVTCYPWTPTGWGGGFDGPGWSDYWGFAAAEFYSTLRFADVDGDHKADVCVRGYAGYQCVLSTGTGFGAGFGGPALSDPNGWSNPLWYSTLQLGDVDGDGKADLCGRDNLGVHCWISQGTAFASTPIDLPAFSDANGWGSALYASTIQLADVNGDGAKDVCGRGPSGAVCALMTPAPSATTCAGPWQYKFESGAASTVKTNSDCPALTNAHTDNLNCYAPSSWSNPTYSIPRRGKTVRECIQWGGKPGGPNWCVKYQNVWEPDPADTCDASKAATAISNTQAALRSQYEVLPEAAPPAGHGAIYPYDESSFLGLGGIGASGEAWDNSSWPNCVVSLTGVPSFSLINSQYCGTYTWPATYPASCIVAEGVTDTGYQLSPAGMSRTALPPAADPNTVSCLNYCKFDPSCPPGMYNKANTDANMAANAGYDGNFNTSASPIEPVGCTFTAPPGSGCVTTTAQPGATMTMPAFTAPVLTSVVAGGHAVYAIGSAAIPTSPSDTTSAVFAWGTNSTYELGNGTKQSSFSEPQVPVYWPSAGVAQIAAGVDDACALLKDGSVHCWGNVATSPPLTWPKDTTVVLSDDQTSLANVVQIAHGDHHACALTASPGAGKSGSVYCWGNNDAAQLGAHLNTDGVTVSPWVTTGLNVSYNGEAKQVDVAAGFLAANGTATAEAPGVIHAIAASGNSTCILADGVPRSGSEASVQGVYCWGDNSNGSLGDGNGGQPGNTSFEAVATKLLDSASKPLNVAKLTGSSIGSSKGGSFCALGAAGGSWMCWGANDEGQLDVFSPPPMVVNPLALPTAMTDGTISMASPIALGPDHGCGVTPSGTFCFGSNDNGELGIPLGTAGQAVPATALANMPVGVPSYTNFGAGPNLTCGIYVAPGAGAPSYGVPNKVGNGACWGAWNGSLSPSARPLLWGQ